MYIHKLTNVSQKAHTVNRMKSFSQSYGHEATQLKISLTQQHEIDRLGYSKETALDRSVINYWRWFGRGGVGGGGMDCRLDPNPCPCSLPLQ